MAVSDGWGDNHSKYIDIFEKEFAAYIGVKHAVATSSCTGAITLGLAALGIGPGDEVLVPDTNWIANVSPIVNLGAKPVFLDIDPVTWCINPDLIQEKITPKTKAVMAVHLYGNVCELSRLLDICKENDLTLIEDAAEALGGSFNNRKLGGFGKFGVFSFHGSKTLTTGEGGMLVTNDDNIAGKVKMLNSHGRDPSNSKQFWSEVVGYKFKMTNLSAAIGVAQLRRIQELIDRKRQILKFYQDRLLVLPELSMNPLQQFCESGAWMPTVVFSKDSGVTREILLENFKKENIDARVFFWPISSMPPFNNGETRIHSYDIPSRAINLPSYHDITEIEMNRVIEVIFNTVQNESNKLQKRDHTFE
jgi:perosamine synthetase